MTCLREHEQGADLLIGYLEDTLAAEQRREIDQHVLTCPDCRELLEVQASLEEFPVPEISVDFDARLYARIAEEAAVPSRWSRWSAWFSRPVFPIAAAATALLAGVLWVQQPAPPAPNDIDPQQLEQALQDLELLMPLTDEI